MSESYGWEAARISVLDHFPMAYICDIRTPVGIRFLVRDKHYGWFAGIQDAETREQAWIEAGKYISSRFPLALTPAQIKAEIGKKYYGVKLYRFGGKNFVLVAGPGFGYMPISESNVPIDAWLSALEKVRSGESDQIIFDLCGHLSDELWRKIKREPEARPHNFHEIMDHLFPSRKS